LSFNSNPKQHLKKLLFIILIFPILTSAQDYVDLLRIGYSYAPTTNFEGMDEGTEIQIFEGGLTFPVVINERHALITGADFSLNHLQLFPQTNATSLYSSTLKLGMASTWTEKWSTTVVLLPKLASDYKHITSSDFYMGLFAVLKFQKKENLIYRFGFYGSQEAFGPFTTPILGWYYLSPNKRFEMDMSLPIAADISYKFDFATLGMDYFGIGRSFRVHYENAPTLYADLSSLEFAAYLQFNTWSENVMLRTKIGYATNDYEMYLDGEKMDLGISAFSFGDDRVQLNPSINGGIYFKVEAIYRFHIGKSDSK